MTINAIRIESILAERDMTKAHLLKDAGYLGKISAPSSGAALASLAQPVSWQPVSVSASQRLSRGRNNDTISENSRGLQINRPEPIFSTEWLQKWYHSSRQKWSDVLHRRTGPFREIAR